MKRATDESPRLVLAGEAKRGPTCAIPQVLTELGFDPAAVFDELGVAPDFFEDPERPLSYVDAGRLLAACAAKTGCEHFGFLLGRRYGVTQLGLVGRVAVLSSDVEAALQAMIRFLPIFDRGAILTLREVGEEVSFVYGIFSDGMTGADQLYDLSLTVAFNALKILCGGNWRPKYVTLPHKAPNDARPFRRYYGAETRFDADEAAIVFDRAWLRQPVSTATVTDWIKAVDRAASVEFMIEVTTAERVRRELRTASPVSWPDEAVVAKRLRISARTLRLLLVGEGVSFRQIVDELRFEAARHYLANSRIELKEIALLLGYSDATAFNRAFRRWSGEAPSAWRAGKRHRPTAV